MTKANGSVIPSKDAWRKMRDVSDEDVRNAVPKVTSYSAACRAVGITDNQANLAQMMWRIEQMGLNVDHFTRSRGAPNGDHTIPQHILFSKRPVKRSPGNVIERIFRDKLKPECCDSCKTPPMWRGKPLMMRLVHINDDVYDMRLENLRILCPNCFATEVPHPNIKVNAKKRENLKLKRYEKILREGN